MKLIPSFLTLISALTLLSCSGNSNNKSTTESTTTNNNSAGEQLYMKNCVVCHQMGGTGIPNAFPPLSNNTTVMGGKTELIKVMLQGKAGEIVVNNMKFNGVMTSFTNLSDNETAQLLTYIRSSFGNKGTAITEEEVKMVRVSN